MSNVRAKFASSVYLVLIDNSTKIPSILLIKRHNTGYCDNMYSLPAGHIEQGESAISAMIREAQEEINIKLTPNDLKFSHLIHRNSPTPNSERFDLFFTATNFIGKIKNNEPQKCTEVNWYKLNELPNNTINYVKNALTNIFNQQIYDEIDW